MDVQHSSMKTKIKEDNKNITETEDQQAGAYLT